MGLRNYIRMETLPTTSLLVYRLHIHLATTVAAAADKILFIKNGNVYIFAETKSHFMKQMKNILFVFLFISFLGINKSVGQGYKISAGLRGGWTSGITGKYFIKGDRAIEAILSSGYRYRGFQITGLYEIHKPAFTEHDVEGFFWFFGGGVHWGGGYHYDHLHTDGTWWNSGYYHEHNYATFGIDGIFGIEFKIPDISVTVGVDVKPYVDFITDRDAPYGFWDSGLSVRYVF